MLRSLPTLLTVVVTLAISHAAHGDDKQKLTYTDPSQTDADFAYQGEYAAPGWGLQVVAGGDGKFTAMLYHGGLPGSGWNGRDRFPCTGQLEGESLALSTTRYGVRVAQGFATIWSRGERIATLVRTHRTSRTLGLAPPSNAKVLFDGKTADGFQNAKLTDDGLLKIGTTTREPVGDFRLHLEFRLPYMPHARGQARANSGVYIQQRYEVQILDSFGLEGIANESGSLYRQCAPLLNMAFEPLTWQTYDIWFRQARWSADGKTKLAPARITVLHNGIPVHWNHAIAGKTGAGKAEGPEEFPIVLQDHGNPVVFRNVWMVEGEPTFAAAVPRRVKATKQVVALEQGCRRWLRFCR